MKHHLFDDKDQNLRIRPATIDDAVPIARLSTQDLPLSEEALDAAQQIVKERLAIASGDDYFTIVAEQKTTGEIVGWLAGGGCRGQELKGWGELYALSSELSGAGTAIDELLVLIALNALRIAQFTGVTILLERGDLMRIEIFEDFGFVKDEDDDETKAEESNPLVRYSLRFKES